MENIATKKFTYDHLSSYKTRGKLGASNRDVRSQRAKENRHLSRMDEVSKRRRMPLSPLADENVVDAVNNEVEAKNDEKKEITSQPKLNRREQLLKWREERKQKKGTEPQKKSFVVRHVKHDNDASLFANAMKKATKGVTPLIKPSQFAADKPVKRATRSSARIAKQATSNLAANPTSHAAKKAEPKSKAAPREKIKEKAEVKPEKTGRVTRQSLRTKAPSADKSAAKSQSSKVAPETNQVKTRSQAKKIKDQPPRETQPSNIEEEEPQKEQTLSSEQNTSNSEKANFPAVDAIKNTVSFGRGSTEGNERGPPSTGSGTEAPSFAPADFQFTAPSGVNTFTYFSKTFKFQPLSPNSAAEFMFPSSASSFFSPKKPAEEKDENPIIEDPVAVFNKSVTSTINEQHDSENVNAEALAAPCDVAMETCEETEKQQSSDEVVENNGTVCLKSAEIRDTQRQPDKVVSEAITVTATESEVMEPQDAVEEQHYASYFRNLVTKETVRLNELCANWENISTQEQNLTEEVTGQIRTTIGQGQLLIDQRFRQFSGLIDLSEDQNAEKQATASDLQGFWEMIYFQVEDVTAKFAALEKSKENNWQEEEKKTKKITKKIKAKKPTAGGDTKASSKLATTRNRIQQMRMAMKAKMAADKEKLKAEKRQQEDEAFVTILTPVKKSKKNDGSDEVVLTPVRRSIRKTPRSALKNTPVVTTPKIVSEDSPGLRLTPDNGNLPNDLAVTGTAMEIRETHEEPSIGEIHEEQGQVETLGEDAREETPEADKDACGSGTDLELKEDGMESDLEQQEPVVLESACKSTGRKSRKTPGRVTFQSPAELEDQQRTPECTEMKVATPLSVPNVDSPAACSPMETDVPNRKKGTPQRFMARKCRGRVSTPYYQNGPRRRVSTVDESDVTENEGQSSGDSDSSDAKANERCPGSGLRRSLRRTPSKYRDAIPLEAEGDQGGKVPTDVSVKLFHTTEESTESETPKNNSEQDAFSKYLCPSSSDEEECAKDPSEQIAENVFEEKEKASNDCPINEEASVTPPEGPQTLVPNSAPKTGRTPIHILRYLSDMDTPSPNSRQITPMPKTTIFVSPSDCSKTPALTDSLGMMSPGNVVRHFPAQNEASPLFPLAGMAAKTSQGSVTPSSALAAFHLDSPVIDEKRRDSVFFAPPSTFDAVRAQDNLMSFSPVVEANDEEQE